MGKNKYSNQRKSRNSDKKLDRDDYSYNDRHMDNSRRKGKRLNPHDWDRFEDDSWRA